MDLRPELLPETCAEYPRVPDITRDELAEIVRRILDCERSEEEQDHYVLVFETNVIRPGALDLIFYPPDGLEDATPEQIVDAAQAYRPIAL